MANSGLMMLMTDTHCILLLGLTDSALALSHFQNAGHQVTAAPWQGLVTESLDNPELDIVYLQPSDDKRAIEELRQILSRRPDVAVVLVCAQPSLDLAIQSWRNGAADILFMPLTRESLDDNLRRTSSHDPDRLLAGDEEAAARFRYLDETGKECWIPIAPPRFTIGRSSTNDLVLATAHISRAQAEILVKESEYYLRDLNSKHGTFVNGIRIDQGVVLRHGDRIRLGGLQGQILTFHKGDLLQSLLASSGSRTDSGLSVHGFREMGMLLATFRALSSIPLLKDLLNLVVDTAIELTGAERGFIMLKEADGHLNFRCARNACKQSLDGASFQTSQRVPYEVFQTGKRIVINDLDLDDASESHTSTRRLGVRSISCVPLCCLSLHETSSLSGVGNIEIIGVLYVDSANIGSGLSKTQIDALDTLASEAAMAIYNARLYKESQLKQKLDEELAIAREIQQALLPAADKILPFVSARSLNLPCHEVGGDYFDYFDMSEDRLGFAVGDVAGKGMPAALLAAMLQGIFCAQTLLNLPLPGMIANINCSLARRNTGGRYVTFFFGILDAEGNCTYINAGHNPPFWIRPDGTLHELTEGGTVLGLFPGASYQSNTIHLEAGDHLVLFTDGLLEARNIQGEEFGEPRLRDLLQQYARMSVPDILDNLQRELAEFSAMTPQHDDITMMVLGFREST
jgi:sigma-B regulation protein RsbU (phosphoserine phosphatase)